MLHQYYVTGLVKAHRKLSALCVQPPNNLAKERKNIMDDFIKNLAGKLSKQVTSHGITITVVLEELSADWWCMQVIGKDNEEFDWYDFFTKPEEAWQIAQNIIKRGGIGKLYSGKHHGYTD